MRKAGVSLAGIASTTRCDCACLFYHCFGRLSVAQGTNLRFYLQKVAAHHGLEFAVTEYGVAEEPGSHSTSKGATFYVTNLREPVS